MQKLVSNIHKTLLSIFLKSIKTTWAVEDERSVGISLQLSFLGCEVTSVLYLHYNVVWENTIVVVKSLHEEIEWGGDHLIQKDARKQFWASNYSRG